MATFNHVTDQSSEHNAPKENKKQMQNNRNVLIRLHFYFYCHFHITHTHKVLRKTHKHTHILYNLVPSASIKVQLL